MELNVGQKVAYPNQGVCLVEDIEKKQIGGNLMKFYALRVLSDNSTIFVPTDNAESVGIRPILDNKECKNLMEHLSDDFTEVSNDWKIRSREFNEKLQSGDVYEACDVLKKLTFLSHEKKLSFREQTLLDKAKFLIVSEILNAGLAKSESNLESKIEILIGNACVKHTEIQPTVMAAAGH
ncbi:MAG: CarD family transcriptional regulator [Pyrinomonadaceae bacterium]